MSSYRTLLSIVVEHDYFADGVCACLDYYPTSETSRIIENTGLLFRKTSRGFQLVYDESRPEALQLYVEDTGDPRSFVFKAYSSDPHFRSYTEPFGAQNSDILYFDNRAPAGLKDDNLSTSDFASSTDFKDIGLFKAGDADLLSRDGQGEAVTETDQLEDILISEDFLSPPEFVLRIFTANKKKKLFEKWPVSTPRTYSIRFNSRKRYWKYYLLGKLASDVEEKDKFEIIEKENRIRFNTLDNEILADRRVARTFRSEHPIPLKDSYRTDNYPGDDHQYKLQLIKNGQINAPVIEQLPVASIDQVGLEEIAQGNNLVSEIYINS